MSGQSRCVLALSHRQLSSSNLPVDSEHAHRALTHPVGLVLLDKKAIAAYTHTRRMDKTPDNTHKARAHTAGSVYHSRQLNVACGHMCVAAAAAVHASIHVCFNSMLAAISTASCIVEALFQCMPCVCV